MRNVRLLACKGTYQGCASYELIRYGMSESAWATGVGNTMKTYHDKVLKVAQRLHG